MSARDPTPRVSMLEQLLAGKNAPAKTPVALELDAAYAAGRTILDYLAANGAAVEVMRKALANSGGGGTDTGFIDPIFSPCATVADVEWFRDNPSKSHSIRPPIDGEPVLACRTPTSAYTVVVRQIGVGIRFLVAIPLARMVIDPASSPVRWENDELLSALFEMATGTAPGSDIDVDRITAWVKVTRSTATATESDSKRRLQ